MAIYILELILLMLLIIYTIVRYFWGGVKVESPQALQQETSPNPGDIGQPIKSKGKGKGEMLIIVSLAFVLVIAIINRVVSREVRWGAERTQRMATVASHVEDSLYLVIDLSEGSQATSYPVSYLSSAPVEGWSDVYKTDKLVLRRIEAGTFMMGSPDDELGRGSGYRDESLHQVTLTKAYYMGVFEITQRQWELVMGENPSKYKGEDHPVEGVTYDAIRGSSEEVNWPAHAKVGSASFMGRLRAKTALDFDLPTEAQWEYACRASTTTALNSGKDLPAFEFSLRGILGIRLQIKGSSLTGTSNCVSMDDVGRYGGNKWAGRGGGFSNHAVVGSYFPNDWGLYDMHGNVFEWVLDWYVASLGTAPVVDPKGGDSLKRSLGFMFRGGCWDTKALWCRSASRGSYDPTYSRDGRFGLRIVTPIER